MGSIKNIEILTSSCHTYTSVDEWGSSSKERSMTNINHVSPVLSPRTLIISLSLHIVTYWFQNFSVLKLFHFLGFIGFGLEKIGIEKGLWIGLEKVTESIPKKSPNQFRNNTVSGSVLFSFWVSSHVLLPSCENEWRLYICTPHYILPPSTLATDWCNKCATAWTIGHSSWIVWSFIFNVQSVFVPELNFSVGSARPLSRFIPSLAFYDAPLQDPGPLLTPVKYQPTSWKSKGYQ